MNKEEILKLRPTFKINGEGIDIVEWYEIVEGGGFYSIRSGLRHADGVTKSPYFFECSIGGIGAEKRALKEFEDFYNNIIKKERDLYKELRTIGLTHSQCDSVIEWSETL